VRYCAVALMHLILSKHSQPVAVDIAREREATAAFGVAPLCKQIVAFMRGSAGVCIPAVQHGESVI
jgi:hypothetical protein